jgi:SAM-dependent methyltransferase
VTANRQQIAYLLRRAGLLEVADWLRYLKAKRAARGARDAFIRQHGHVALPPDDFAYDAYGALDWPAYWNSGLETAVYLGSILMREVAAGSPRRVLEWGCGPARIVRHLGNQLQPPDAWQLFASDYNSRTIHWCRAHIEGVTFLENQLAPPLVFEEASLHAIYCISVFTHLSQAMHKAWIHEIGRILCPGGLLIASLHGDACRDWLLPHEREQYDRGELIVRGEVKEGKRTYVAYHPPAFVRNVLFHEFELVSCETSPIPSLGLHDVWVIRKR